MERDFTAESSDLRWIGDITEFKCVDGKLFLAGVHDRSLAGWSMGNRQTAVSLWIAAGANPKATATWAGYSSVSTILDIYGHLLPGSEEPVMDALDRMQSSPQGEVIELRR